MRVFDAARRTGGGGVTGKIRRRNEPTPILTQEGKNINSDLLIGISTKVILFP